MRTFDTGATRNSDAGRPDFEGFLSPLVLERYAGYMHRNRLQADGSIRASDNWQRGIPLSSYMKSLWRHTVEAWKIHRGYGPAEAIEDALCGILFNAMGYLHERLLRRLDLAEDRPAPAEDCLGGAGPEIAPPPARRRTRRRAR